MRGGKVYRNTLPNSCPRLGFEEAFSYSTSINQLCSTEIIYVLEQIGGVTYLSGIIQDVPTAANVEHYANIVKEKGAS